MSQSCCPEGYSYVNSSGYYTDSILGPILVTNNAYTAPTLAEVVDHCVIFANRGFAESPIATEECPCCPQGYIYSQLSGGCCPGNNPGGICAAQFVVPTIPCIPCDCSEPPQRVCETCDNDTLPIAFTLNTDRKACTDCESQQGAREIPHGGKVNTFMPYFLLDPGTNFIRK